jgi:membrane-bound lytic murein transglycosylase B
MPDENLQASIIQPLGGPAFMVFKNFRVLLTYNNSNFYAGSVGYLADQICLSMHRVTPGFAFNQGATEFTEKR